MNKFWEWMTEKKYAPSMNLTGFIIVIGDEGETAIKATKQMLFGYMIEYLLSKGISFGMSNPFDAKGFADRTTMGINIFYQKCERYINVIEENNI
jgi:hypothetical protein